MFRASSCPSSGATTTAVAASALLSELGESSAVGRGRAGRPDHDQQHNYCSCWALDDGREDARSMLSCKETSSNKPEELLHLVGWFISIVWWCTDLLTLNLIRHILWNPIDQCRVHKITPPFSIASQIKPVHVHISYFFHIHFSIILLSTPTSYNWSLSPKFPTKIRYAPVMSSHTLHSPHDVSLYLICSLE